MVFRDADLLCPDVIGLVVVKVYGDIQLFRLYLQHACEEFPRPGDGLLLEIILKAEVAQHFKEGAVAGGDAHALDIRRADALLTGSHAVAGRLFLPQKPLFHGRHARVDEQQAVVVVRHQREAAKAQMPLAFKKRKVFLAQFVQACPFHTVRISPLSIHISKKNSPRPVKGRRPQGFRGTTQVARKARRFSRL